MEKENIDFIAYTFQMDGLEQITKEMNPPEDKIIHTQLFSTDKVFGSYFSCIFKGKLRIHVVFTEDTIEYKDTIAKLILETVEQTGISEGKIWICNQNSKMIDYLMEQFHIIEDSEPFLYESHEMIMPRDQFHKTFEATNLEIRPYQEEHIDDYLSLLYHSMSFKIPPYNYILEKDSFIQEFRRQQENQTFEAFWIKDDLVGLYWLAGSEIDHIAVAKKYQGLGYGKQILTRAIEIDLRNPEVDHAWLLVVEWNSKAFHFYKKYGMQERAVYHVPYRDTI